MWLFWLFVHVCAIGGTHAVFPVIWGGVLVLFGFVSVVPFVLVLLPSWLFCYLFLLCCCAVVLSCVVLCCLVFLS